ncbi:hypothetical protein [Bradyrhizobium phage BDU-MI-1]|nr:hypothetical protein [Bradyrhizobium phage BDU-MI-1]
MDLFKPGSGVTIKMLGPNGELTDLGGFPDFLTNSEGETQDCGCPPGVCLGEDDDLEAAQAEYAAIDGFINAIFGGGPAGDDFDDDEDFDIEEAEQAELEAKIEAVAQLGRIAEGLAKVANLHALMLRDLLEA